MAGRKRFAMAGLSPQSKHMHPSGFFYGVQQVRCLQCCAAGFFFGGDSNNVGPSNSNSVFPALSWQSSSYIQRRWKKPSSISAKEYIEGRTRDLTFEKLMEIYKKRRIIVRVQELILNRRDHNLSVQLLAKWRYKAGLTKPAGMFLKRYPHIFEVYQHPLKRAPWCRLAQKALDLIEEEKKTIKENEPSVIDILKKLLMMSTSGMLKISTLGLVSREFGLPDDFRDSILLKYPEIFRVINGDMVGLVSTDPSLAVAQVEKWREKEYTEKWLSEFETRFAFKLEYPTGFRIEKGFKEKMKNWQRLRYLSPYEGLGKAGVEFGGGLRHFEKRAVGILHEFLSLTVEKMIQVERISHFRKDFKMELNVRDLIIEHPGIFYLSTKGNTLTVFLREAYCRGRLIEPNPVYAVRRKLMDLIVLGRLRTRELRSQLVENVSATLDDKRAEAEQCTGAEVELGAGLNDEYGDVSPDDGAGSSSEDDEGEEWHLNVGLSEDDEDGK